MRNMVYFGIALIIIIPLFLLVTSYEPPKEIPNPFKMGLWSNNPVNPSLTIIEFEIVNAGDKPAFANCSIVVNDRSNSYKGSDFFNIPESIPPNVSKKYTVEVKVSNEGAAFIDTAYISCKPNQY